MPKINIKAKTENNRKNIKKNFKNMNKDNTTNKFYSNSIYDKRKVILKYCKFIHNLDHFS